MSRLLSVFTTRETAVVVWVAGFLVFAFTKPGVRETSFRLVTTFFHPKILGPVVLSAAYVSLVVLSAYIAGLWTLTLLKDTIIWFIFSALALNFRLASSNSTTVDLTTLLHDTLGLIVLIQFLVGTYTFPLAAEIIIVPAIAALAGLTAVSADRDEHRLVHNILSGVQAFIALTIVLTALIKAGLDYRELASLNTARVVLLPAVLTLAYVPFLYVLVLVVRHESLFVRLSMLCGMIPL